MNKLRFSGDEIFLEQFTQNQVSFYGAPINMQIRTTLVYSVHFLKLNEWKYLSIHSIELNHENPIWKNHQFSNLELKPLSSKPKTQKHPFKLIHNYGMKYILKSIYTNNLQNPKSESTHNQIITPVH